MCSTRGPDCGPFQGLAPSPRNSSLVPGHSCAMNLTCSPPCPISRRATRNSGVSSRPTANSRCTKADSGRWGLAGAPLRAAEDAPPPPPPPPPPPLGGPGAASADTPGSAAWCLPMTSKVSSISEVASSTAFLQTSASCPLTWSTNGPVSVPRPRLVPAPRSSTHVPGHIDVMRLMFSPPWPSNFRTARDCRLSSRVTGNWWWIKGPVAGRAGRAGGPALGRAAWTGFAGVGRGAFRPRAATVTQPSCSKPPSDAVSLASEPELVSGSSFSGGGAGGVVFAPRRGAGAMYGGGDFFAAARSARYVSTDNRGMDAT
mmetsp:Transcript_54266/g.156882  ORF Transcript_54266/g.156882 Transcript_54266/m.156882 type:complete len:315 (+) Transcript_54266:280-1224(+)